jgi:hypothetical protein
MKKAAVNEVKTLVKELIMEGSALTLHKRHAAAQGFVERRSLAKRIAGCKSLHHMMGPDNPWASALIGWDTNMNQEIGILYSPRNAAQSKSLVTGTLHYE